MAAPPNTTDALVSRLARGNTPPIEIPQALSAIFDSPDYETSIQKLSGKDLEMWVERLDQVRYLRISHNRPMPHHFSVNRFYDSHRATSEQGSALTEKDMRIEEDPTLVPLFLRKVVEDQQSPGDDDRW